MAGIDLRTVADLLGHANILMTMRYAQSAPAHNSDALKSFPHSMRSVRKLLYCSPLVRKNRLTPLLTPKQKTLWRLPQAVVRKCLFFRRMQQGEGA
jgi:hypothetical protein